ncbi:MAG TPA: hypothetical protein VLV29_08050 [Steroidobacteraceae bacterium]|nr:hypothetical protein [Steroidobacteraceae bacterium]
MDLSVPCRARRVLAALVAVVCLGASAQASADDATVQAVWTPKPLRFTFMGFTAKYSCDGLTDHLRRILLLMGARSDLKLTPVGCSSGFGRPSPFPGVEGTVNVLEPLGDKEPAPDQQPVAAHWQHVVLAPRGDPLRAAGDCELSEQVKTSILPLFATRNIAYNSTCIPHQLQVGGTQLSADFLVLAPQHPPAP